LQVARLGRDVARLAQTIAAIGNVNAATDAAAGAIMARAAVEIAALNVRINGVGLADQVMVAEWGRELDALMEETVKLAAAASATAAERGGF
jgi:formiminotetrahydrofolate cyclodeaminase